jgi:hypothetical protein
VVETAYTWVLMGFVWFCPNMEHNKNEKKYADNLFEREVRVYFVDGFQF